MKKYNTYKEFRESSKAYQVCVKRKLTEKVKQYYEKV